MFAHSTSNLKFRRCTCIEFCKRWHGFLCFSIYYIDDSSASTLSLFLVEHIPKSLAHLLLLQAAAYDAFDLAATCREHLAPRSEKALQMRAECINILEQVRECKPPIRGPCIIGSTCLSITCGASPHQCAFQISLQLCRISALQVMLGM